MLSERFFRFHSATGNYLYIVQDADDDLTCHAHQHFTVHYTINKANENHNLTFYYVVKSFDKIFKLRKVSKQPQKLHTITVHSLQNVVGAKHKFTKIGTSVDTFSIKFKLDSKILSKYQILVYYVLPNGDVIGDTREVAIKPCTSNQVLAEWAQKHAHPGDTLSLKIKTSPNSLCSLSAVDEATRYRSDDNFNLKKLLDIFTLEKPDLQYFSSSRLNCVRHIKKPPLESQRLIDHELRRKKRDASEAHDADTSVMLKVGRVVLVVRKHTDVLQLADVWGCCHY